jgi:hypothetical protein
VQNSNANRSSFLCDAIGILIIGVQLYWVLRWPAPNGGSRFILGILAYIVLAALAVYLWHKEPPVEHLSGPGEWAAAILGSVLLGGVSFGIDMLIGLFNYPKLTPIDAGTKAGSPFGFPLTLMFCPGFTMVAIAGLVRALLLQERSETRNSAK